MITTKTKVDFIGCNEKKKSPFLWVIFQSPHTFISEETGHKKFPQGGKMELVPEPPSSDVPSIEPFIYYTMDLVEKKRLSIVVQSTDLFFQVEVEIR